MLPRHHYFFCYITSDGEPIELRRPDGGIVVMAMTECEAVDKAYGIANERYPLRPGQFVVVMERHCRKAKRHAELMDEDWKFMHADFEAFMSLEPIK